MSNLNAEKANFQKSVLEQVYNLSTVEGTLFLLICSENWGI
jgi:hypothetical protein